MIYFLPPWILFLNQLWGLWFFYFFLKFQHFLGLCSRSPFIHSSWVHQSQRFSWICQWFSNIFLLLSYLLRFINVHSTVHWYCCTDASQVPRLCISTLNSSLVSLNFSCSGPHPLLVLRSEKGVILVSSTSFHIFTFIQLASH